MTTETMKTEYPNREMSGNELRVGDIVALFEGPFNTAIVSNVTEKEITFFRPYGHHSEFAYTGGVITYTGTETFSRALPTSQTYFVYQRNPVK